MASITEKMIIIIITGKMFSLLLCLWGVRGWVGSEDFREYEIGQEERQGNSIAKH